MEQVRLFSCPPAPLCALEALRGVMLANKRSQPQELLDTAERELIIPWGRGSCCFSASVWGRRRSFYVCLSLFPSFCCFLFVFILSSLYASNFAWFSSPSHPNSRPALSNPRLENYLGLLNSCLGPGRQSRGLEGNAFLRNPQVG